MQKLIYLITTIILLTISNITFVDASYQSGAGTKVTANIPSKVDIRIYGYTAPNALVQASSIRVFAQVSSDKTGYFLIDPLSVSNEAREVCLTTIDSEQRSGFPLCIGIPDIVKPTEIGPILLSPTISINNNQIIQLASLAESRRAENQGQATGVTIPNSEIEISFFDNASTGITLIPPVEAKSIPKITTSTDKNGSFSINLPAAKALTYRIFAKAFYGPTSPYGLRGAGKSPTPNSLTLTYSVVSYSNYWLKNILPGIIFWFLFMLSLIALIWWEIKTGKGRLALGLFSETRLKPFGVRLSLTHRRIWYNFQARLKSDQI